MFVEFCEYNFPINYLFFFNLNFASSHNKVSENIECNNRVDDTGNRREQKIPLTRHQKLIIHRVVIWNEKSLLE